MRQLTALVALMVAAFGAVAAEDFARARALGLEIISAELEGGLCTPATVPEEKRRELSNALEGIAQAGLADPTGLDPLNLAVVADDVPALIRLTSLGYPLGSPGNSLLHDAALHDSRRSLSYMLRQGLDPNGPNAYGATALMTAAANGRIAVASALILAGASPSVRNKDGGTALHYAIGCNDPAMVELLLAAGAAVDSNAVALAEKHGLTLQQPER